LCDLPIKARLGQLIARDLIVAQITPPEHLFAWPQRGIHAYVDAMREAFAVGGPFAVTLDIENFYQSIEASAVYALHILPDELVRYCIDPHFLRFRYVGDRSSPAYHPVTAADPGGLLQGGPASPALVVALLGDIFVNVPASAFPRGYADDFAVFGRDQNSAEIAAGELARHLAGSAMGPLQVRSVVHDVRDGCDHVGCYFVRIGDDVECWIPDSRLTAVIVRMKERIRAASPDERGRGVQHFARVAMGPYRWAVEWQRVHVLEEAEHALQETQSDRNEQRQIS
jgi:hypothetical protein